MTSQLHTGLMWHGEAARPSADVVRALTTRDDPVLLATDYPNLDTIGVLSYTPVIPVRLRDGEVDALVSADCQPVTLDQALSRIAQATGRTEEQVLRAVILDVEGVTAQAYRQEVGLASR